MRLDDFRAGTIYQAKSDARHILRELGMIE
jgi:hypothetical protein